jgi:heme exporter protein D
MMQFLAMGGYAVFVWPSYALSVIVLAALTAWALREHASARAMLERLENKKS